MTVDNSGGGPWQCGVTAAVYASVLPPPHHYSVQLLLRVLAGKAQGAARDCAEAEAQTLAVQVLGVFCQCMLACHLYSSGISQHASALAPPHHYSVLLLPRGVIMVLTFHRAYPGCANGPLVWAHWQNCALEGCCECRRRGCCSLCASTACSARARGGGA